jgi:hypothetical protein
MFGMMMVMNARFQVLTATSFKMAAFWNVASCSLVDMGKETVMEYFKVLFSAFT